MNIDVIGSLVRKRRKDLGIDQIELGRIAGVSTHALSNIESGVGNPTLKTVAKVLHALGLELTIEPRPVPSLSSVRPNEQP